MRLGFGFLTCERNPTDRRTHAAIYGDAIALVEEVERLGFDSVWVPEHHFWDDGYVSSPLVLCSAIAARTSRITIGTGMAVGPLYAPLRLAEDAATLDLISGGRFTLGLGLGWRAEEFDGFDVSRERLGLRLETLVGTLRLAWSDELVGGVSVTPKPAGAGPQIWLGGRSDTAMRRAARLADGFLATPSSVERFGARARLLLDELDRAGRRPESFTLSLFVPVFAWPGADAWLTVRDAYRFATWKYGDMAEARGRRPPSALPPPLTPAEDDALRSSMRLGSADDLAASLCAYEEAAGVEIELVAQAYWPGLDPNVQRESIAYFAEAVAPLLRH